MESISMLSKRPVKALLFFTKSLEISVYICIYVPSDKLYIYNVWNAKLIYNLHVLDNLENYLMKRALALKFNYRNLY